MRPLGGPNPKDLVEAGGCCKGSGPFRSENWGIPTGLGVPGAICDDANFEIREWCCMVAPIEVPSRWPSRSRCDGTGAIGVVDGRVENFPGPREAGLMEGEAGKSPSSSSPASENAPSPSSASLSGAIDPGGNIVDMENGCPVHRVGVSSGVPE